MPRSSQHGARQVREEPPVVTHHHVGAAPARKLLLQPLDGRQVEMVGGLVEQHDVGLSRPAPAPARRAAPRRPTARPVARRRRASCPSRMGGDAIVGRSHESASAVKHSRRRWRSRRNPAPGEAWRSWRRAGQSGCRRRRSARPPGCAAGSTCRRRCGRPATGARRARSPSSTPSRIVWSPRWKRMPVRARRGGSAIGP